MDPKHSVEASYSACSRADQLGATLLGVAFERAWVVRSCICNAHNALVLRHGVPQPPITAELLEPTEAILRNFELSYMDMHEHFSGWLSKWSATKQRAILDSIARDELALGQLTPFVKRETAHKEPTKGRLIQGYRNMRTQALFGPEFTCVQKALCAVFNLAGCEVAPGIRLTIASGFNADELGQWMTNCLAEYSSPVFYERDGKAWDATMQKPHHDFKQIFNRRVCEPLADFVDANFKCRATLHSTTGTLRYTLVGTVKSGHNDTTSGNSIVNGYICASAMAKLGLKGHAIVAGDDLLACIDGEFDLSSLLKAEASYGIRPEGAKFRSPLDVTFISACWLPDGHGGHLFVPLLGRLMARLWWTVNPPGRRHLDVYRHSVASGLLAAVRGIPLYDDYVRAGDRTADRIIAFHKHVRERADRVIDPAAVSRALRDKYELTVAEFDHLRTLLRTVGDAVIISDPVASRVMHRDLCDIDVRPCSV